MLKLSLTSFLKRRVVIVTALFLIASILVAGVVAWLSRPAEMTLRLGAKEYSVKVVSGESERIKGLSGTASLSRDKGMLFDFGEEGEWGIWMKDMNYPIDILWIDSSKTIVDIVENAEPSSYPSTTFRPKKPATYVLELAAGGVVEASVSVGDQVSFDLENYRREWS